MGASGATFGWDKSLPCHGDAVLTKDYSFFMGIGSVIRSDADPRMHEMYMRARRRPIVMMANPAWRRNP